MCMCTHIHVHVHVHVHKCMYMLGAKHGFAQSVDCPVQSVDPCFALAINRLTHNYVIPGLHMHDEREGPLLAAWLVIGTVESN